MLGKKRFAISILIILAIAMLLLCACGDDGDTTPISPPQEGPIVCQEPSGMDRFSKEAVAEYGCPDADKVPSWIEIPECQ